MEHGVEIEVRAAAQPPAGHMAAPYRAMTEQILAQADTAGYRAALVDATDGTVTAWPRLARTVRAAARGLARRGLAPGDTAGVLVKDAASFAVAVNAIRAAGAVAVPLSPDTGACAIAAQLEAARSRLLITSATLAELAAQAADRSRVRQIIAFGDAPGTTPFSALLTSARHAQPDQSADGEPAGLLAGQTGRFRADAAALAPRDVVVAAPPCGDGDVYTSLVDLTLLAGATLVAAPLPLVTAAMRVYKGTALIVPRGTPVGDVPASRVFTVSC